ncbi:hypothetical protein O3M35_007044 [Rhynocoris fuscipes]|uniref:Cytochrome P450 n=1 Tax=Rhynocoris fuscipes TaxID=488301 RepID=A0AAW1DI36_9HEMI
MQILNFLNAYFYPKPIFFPGEYTLPAGCTLYIRLHCLHRNPKFWSHPNEFYPDHFLSEAIANRPKGCYFPFSAGPRGCPGKLYGTIVMKTLLSTLLRKYKFEDRSEI